jgi:hypothetical protein
VTARSSRDDVIEGEVVNVGPEALDDVAVFHSARSREIGRLEPGEARPFELVDVHVFRPFADPAEIWGNGFDRRPTDTAADRRAWASFEQRVGLNTYAGGTVLAVGWHTSAPAPIEALDGTTPVGGRSTHVARARVEADGPRLTNAASQRVIVRLTTDERFGPPEPSDLGPPTTFAPAQDGTITPTTFAPPPNGEIAPTTAINPVQVEIDPGGIGADVWYRIVLPVEVAGRAIDRSRLVVEIPAGVGAISVWSGDEWATASAPDAGPALVGLPPTAVTEGAILVRMGLREQVAEYVTVRELDPGEVAHRPLVPAP